MAHFIDALTQARKMGWTSDQIIQGISKARPDIANIIQKQIQAGQSPDSIVDMMTKSALRTYAPTPETKAPAQRVLGMMAKDPAVYKDYGPAAEQAGRAAMVPTSQGLEYVAAAKAGLPTHVAFDMDEYEKSNPGLVKSMLFGPVAGPYHLAEGAKNLQQAKTSDDHARAIHEMASGVAEGGAPLLIPAAGAAPVATGTGLIGSYVGGKAARLGAQALGASDPWVDVAEDAGNLLGGVGGGKFPETTLGRRVIANTPDFASNTGKAAWSAAKNAFNWKTGLAAGPASYAIEHLTGNLGLSALPEVAGGLYGAYKDGSLGSAGRSFLDIFRKPSPEEVALKDAQMREADRQREAARWAALQRKMYRSTGAPAGPPVVDPPIPSYAPANGNGIGIQIQQPPTDATWVPDPDGRFGEQFGSQPQQPRANDWTQWNPAKADYNRQPDFSLWGGLRRPEPTNGNGIGINIQQPPQAKWMSDAAVRAQYENAPSQNMERTPAWMRQQAPPAPAPNPLLQNIQNNSAQQMGLASGRVPGGIANQQPIVTPPPAEPPTVPVAESETPQVQSQPVAGPTTPNGKVTLPSHIEDHGGVQRPIAAVDDKTSAMANYARETPDFDLEPYMQATKLVSDTIEKNGWNRRMRYSTLRNKVNGLPNRDQLNSALDLVQEYADKAYDHGMKGRNGNHYNQDGTWEGASHDTLRSVWRLLHNGESWQPTQQ